MTYKAEYSTISQVVSELLHYTGCAAEREWQLWPSAQRREP
jgi:hypothetical protein